MALALKASLRESVEAALAEIGESGEIASAKPVDGGCVNTTLAVSTAAGRTFFLKANDAAPPGMFEREAEGLLALRAAGAVRAPEPLAWRDEAGRAFLLMEFIPSAEPGKDHAETLGRQLAALHRVRAGAFGLAHDNFIGATPQINTGGASGESWPDFFRRARLGALLERLDKRGYATGELRRGLERIMDKMEDLLGRRAVEPSLLHGDLWSGNIMSDQRGEPVMIDPAVYHGDRETDLAMTELFGRFDSMFYAAYREAWPLDAGYETRKDIYNLYHLLNHLLMFGLSYMSGVMAVVRRYS